VLTQAGLSRAPLPQVGLVYLWYDFLIGDMQRQMQQQRSSQPSPQKAKL
jgi:hypothetical protein